MAKPTKPNGRLRIDSKQNEELIKLLCLRYTAEPLQAGDHPPFDHALNDDMIRLAKLDEALCRLSGMRDLDTHRIATSLLEEMEQLRHRVDARAKSLPPKHLS